MRLLGGRRTVAAAAVLACLCATPARAAPSQHSYTQLPATIDADAHYVLYLHGRIIEDAGIRPTHAEYGVYEYVAILDALAARGYKVISEVRPSGAATAEFGPRVVDQVRQLIARGVPPSRITVIGFSKGGSLAILAAAALEEPEVNFVFLAACGEWVFDAGIEVVGRVLSIYERSDAFGKSCSPLFDASPGPLVHEENANITDVSAREIIYLTPIVVMMVWIGVGSKSFTDLVEPTIVQYLDLLN